MTIPVGKCLGTDIRWKDSVSLLRGKLFWVENRALLVSICLWLHPPVSKSVLSLYLSYSPLIYSLVEIELYIENYIKLCCSCSLDPYIHILKSLLSIYSKNMKRCTYTQTISSFIGLWNWSSCPLYFDPLHWTCILDSQSSITALLSRAVGMSFSVPEYCLVGSLCHNCWWCQSMAPISYTK